MKTSNYYFTTVRPATRKAVAATPTNDRAHKAAVWFPGLNALRFLAAGLVVIMHTHNNMGLSGLPQLPPWPVLFKGLAAVSFFFVLSGFLITYLLLREKQDSAAIRIAPFYLRRVFRIWPLYFIVIATGILFYWKLVPALHLHFETAYPHGLALLLYSFFLANLMNSLYHVGGMLHITWSIAVEEQFYLFWAPLVKRFYNKLPWLIGGVTVLSLTVNILNNFNAFGLSEGMRSFLGTLQFHYMGLGAGFAWYLFNYKQRLLHLPVFTSRLVQWLCLGLLGSYLLLYRKAPTGDAVTALPLGLLFGWLIVNISVNPKRLFSLDNPVLNYLGNISYGIYMYHMPVVYAAAFLFQHQPAITTRAWIYFPAYFLLVFVLTIAIASASYYCIEQPILRKMKR